MAKQISSLNVVLNATVAPFVGAFNGLKATIGGFVSSIVGAGASLLKFTGIAGAIGAVFGAFKGLGSGISLAAELEQNAVAFETMLGSATAAKGLLGQLQSFAASTPFEFPEIAAAGKSLLAFGVTADQIPATLQAVGDVASGVGTDFGELAQIYGKAKTSGRLMAEDVNQLTGRGIPIIAELAKQFGVSQGEVKGLVTAGKVGFPQLQQAFASMTGEGGQFSGMMAKQSQTLAGLWSTLSDNIGMTLAGIVTSIVDAFKLRDALKALVAFTGTAGAWMQSKLAVLAPIVMGVAGSVWAVVTNAFNGVVAFVSPILASIVGYFRTHGQAILTSVVGYYVAAWGVVKDVLSGAWSLVTTVAGGIFAAWDWAMTSMGMSSLTAAVTTGGAMGTIGKIFEWLADAVTTAVTIAGFAIANWRTIVELAGTQVMLAFVRLGAEVAHMFGTVIPAYLAYLMANWRNIFTDIENFTAAFATNVGKNIWKFVAAVASAISGGGFDFEWTGLTDGFKSSMAALPEIAAREAGPLEAALQAQAEGLKTSLADGLAAKFAGNASATSGITDAIMGGANQVGDALATIPKPDVTLPKPDPLKLDTTAANAALDETKKKAAGVTDVGNILSGSAEQWQRMSLAASSVPAGSTAVPVAAATQAAMREGPKANAAKAGAAASLDTLAALLAKIHAELKGADRLELTEAGPV